MLKPTLLNFNFGPLQHLCFAPAHLNIDVHQSFYYHMPHAVIHFCRSGVPKSTCSLQMSEAIIQRNRKTKTKHRKKLPPNYVYFMPTPKSILKSTSHQLKKGNLGQTSARLPRNGAILWLFKISFQYILARQSKIYGKLILPRLFGIISCQSCLILAKNLIPCSKLIQMRWNRTNLVLLILLLIMFCCIKI